MVAEEERHSDGERDEGSAAAAAAAREAQFRDLVLPYTDALYGMALRQTHNPDDAQDLVQETFLRAWRSFDTLVPGSNVKAWLFRILINTHIDRFRKAAHHIEAEPDEEIDTLYLHRAVQASEIPGAEANPEEAFFKVLTGPEVDEALRALPPRWRDAFHLVDTEGFSYKEAADILGMPIGTLMSSLHRARLRLQKELWDYCVRVGICRPVKPPPPIKPDCADACRHIYAFLDGTLGDEAARQVEGHLAHCLECCARVEFQRRLRQVIRDRYRGKVPRAVRGRLSRVLAFLK